MSFPQFLEFSGNHPFLILAFLATLALLVMLEFRHRMSGMKTVGPIEATQLNNHDNALFLDIRDTADFNNGHIPDAVNIPLKQLTERFSDLKKHRNSNQPVIAYCRSGNASIAAGNILKKNGIENAYNLSGGILAWQSANMPVSKQA